MNMIPILYKFFMNIYSQWILPGGLISAPLNSLLQMVTSVWPWLKVKGAPQLINPSGNGMIAGKWLAWQHILILCSLGFIHSDWKITLHTAAQVSGELLLWSADVLHRVNMTWEVVWIIQLDLWTGNYRLPKLWKPFGKVRKSYLQVRNWEESHPHNFPGCSYHVHDISWTHHKNQ